MNKRLKTIDNIDAQLSWQLYRQIRGQHDQVYWQLRGQLYDQLRGLIRGQIDEQIWWQQRVKLWDQLRKELNDE